MDEAATVIHVREMRAGDVYIGRRNYSGGRRLAESIWANPFHIGRDGTREEAIAKYESRFKTLPYLQSRLHELKGKRLACWCAPEACHGDPLARWVNALEGGGRETISPSPQPSPAGEGVPAGG